jgi:hypothetical protein
VSVKFGRRKGAALYPYVKSPVNRILARWMSLVPRFGAAKEPATDRRQQIGAAIFCGVRSAADARAGNSGPPVSRSALNLRRTT